MKLEINIEDRHTPAVLRALLSAITESPITELDPPEPEQPEQPEQPEPEQPEPEPAPAPVAAAEPEPADPEVDSAGVRWDPAIHSGNKSKLKNGRWRTKKGASVENTPVKAFPTTPATAPPAAPQPGLLPWVQAFQTAVKLMHTDKAQQVAEVAKKYDAIDQKTQQPNFALLGQAHTKTQEAALADLRALL